MDQHAIPREKLVIPQQVGIEAEDGNIIGQAAEHPSRILSADNCLAPTPNRVPLLRLDEGVRSSVPYRNGQLPFPAAVLLSDGRAVARQWPAVRTSAGHLTLGGVSRLFLRFHRHQAMRNREMLSSPRPMRAKPAVGTTNTIVMTMFVVRAKGSSRKQRNRVGMALRSPFRNDRAKSLGYQLALIFGGVVGSQLDLNDTLAGYLGGLGQLLMGDTVLQAQKAHPADGIHGQHFLFGYDKIGFILPLDFM